MGSAFRLGPGDSGSIPNFRFTLRFLSCPIRIVTFSKGSPPSSIEYQPWTILKTNQWIGDAIHVKHGFSVQYPRLLTHWLILQGFAIPEEKQSSTIPFVYEGQEYTLTHGDVVISAITSCTNTSNPSVMLGAGKLYHNEFLM